MKKAEQRRVAIGAARARLRKYDHDPVDATWEDALAELDALLQEDKTLVAAMWYASATDAQVNLFRREWNRWTAERKAWRNERGLLEKP